MAKEVAISKRAKISEAQQYMLLSVFAASIFLGVALSLNLRFIKQISFNSEVIAEEEKSIVKYSDAIKTIGICIAPKGSIYSDKELDSCNPDNINISDIPNTLRYNILKNLASNEALNSVKKETIEDCVNPTTNKNYTYEELEEKYNKATDSNGLKIAAQLIKSCSSLRAIPDALPSEKNAEALGASINKIFNESNWLPNSISVSPDTTKINNNLSALSVNFSIESDSATTLKVLDNIERSIREFGISSATIEWGNNNALNLSIQASAYYINGIKISESTKTLNPKGAKK